MQNQRRPHEKRSESKTSEVLNSLNLGLCRSYWFPEFLVFLALRWKSSSQLHWLLIEWWALPILVKIRKKKFLALCLLILGPARHNLRNLEKNWSHLGFSNHEICDISAPMRYFKWNEEWVLTQNKSNSPSQFSHTFPFSKLGIIKAYTIKLHWPSSYKKFSTSSFQ